MTMIMSVANERQGNEGTFEMALSEDREEI